MSSTAFKGTLSVCALGYCKYRTFAFSPFVRLHDHQVIWNLAQEGARHGAINLATPIIELAGSRALCTDQARNPDTDRSSRIATASTRKWVTATHARAD